MDIKCRGIKAVHDWFWLSGSGKELGINDGRVNFDWWINFSEQRAKAVFDVSLYILVNGE